MTIKAVLIIGYTLPVGTRLGTNTWNSINYDNMSKISYENIKRTEAVLNGRKYNFRSQAEFRYACYLCHLKELGRIKEWKYEPKRFAFSVGQSAIVKSYLPDFWLYYPNGTHAWVEIKGRKDAKSRQQLKLFQRQYPNEVLHLLTTGSPDFLRRALIGRLWAEKNNIQWQTTREI